jgi:hypothetical protein
MNAVIEQPKKSVLTDMANRFGMEEVAFQATVIDICFHPKKKEDVPTTYELYAFLLVAKEYRLNPLTKEIYGFRTKAGAIQPIVSIDGWCNLVNSHPSMNGMEFTDHISGSEMTAITCRLWRKDREKPIEVTEYMAECQRDGEVWKKWPRRMLRHKALIQCARYAFGFAGIVDPDEAERIDEATMRDVTPTAPEPTVTAAKTEPEARTVTSTADAAGKPGEVVVWEETAEKTQEKPAATDTGKVTPLDPPEPVLKKSPTSPAPSAETQRPTMTGAGSAEQVRAGDARPQMPQAGQSIVPPAADSAAPTDKPSSADSSLPGSATTAPASSTSGDGLDIPPFLRRGRFDETAWKEEVTAKTAAAATDEALIEMQQTLCIPNRQKISDEGWAWHVDLIRGRIKEFAQTPPPFDWDKWIDGDLAAAISGSEGIEELNNVKNNILLPAKPNLTPEQWKRAAQRYNNRLKELTPPQDTL